MEKMNLFGEFKIPSFDTNHLTELQLLSTSKGNQRKWYKDGLYIKEQFYYQNKYWRDDLVENIASCIGQQFETNEYVLEQHLCTINDGNNSTHGVFSKDFCSEGEKYLSLQRLLDTNKSSFDTDMGCPERYEFLLNFLQEVTDLPFGRYLDTMIILDYLVGNEDRHLNNIGVIWNGTKFRYAPLFDFGLGLFEHDRKYEGVPFAKCLNKMESKPFSSDNQRIVDYRLNYGIQIKLPKKLILSNCEIPSMKAGSYLRNRCLKLGIELEGVL